jgi:hypothetical protein
LRKRYIVTYITFEPEFIINTGSIINVPFNIIQLPFNILYTAKKIKVYDVDRFGKLIFVADGGGNLLYLPTNNIKSLDCRTIFLVDGLPAACFTRIDCCGHIIIDQDGKVFRPEILKRPGEYYETPTFTFATYLIMYIIRARLYRKLSLQFKKLNNIARNKNV